MNIDINALPVVGWVVILILGLSITGILGYGFYVLRSKNLKTKIFELTEKKEHETVKRELAMSEGKDQLDNQCQVAKNILKELRIRIFEKGIETFLMVDKKDQVIFELITHRIIDRLNYDIKNDLTRNHITHKSNYELEQYTRAKARGYFSMIKDRLYTLNEYLPSYNLPEVMERMTLQEVETLLKDVYFSARRITGHNGEKTGGYGNE